MDRRTLFLRVLPLCLWLPCVGAWAEGVTWDFAANDRFNTVMAAEEPIVYVEDREPLYVLQRFVVQGTSGVEWTEALEVLNTWRDDHPRKVAGWYARFKKQSDATCPGQWTVIAEDKTSLTFERITGACAEHEAQHAVYRVLYGEEQVFTLVATRKGGMDEVTRANWLTLLATAKIFR